jgi:hypothetical protein
MLTTQVTTHQRKFSGRKLTCQVDGTGSVWKKATAKLQYYLILGAITACNGARHFHSHLPDIHDELVPKDLRIRNMHASALPVSKYYFCIYERQFVNTGFI